MNPKELIIGKLYKIYNTSTKKGKDQPWYFHTSDEKGEMINDSNEIKNAVVIFLGRVKIYWKPLKDYIELAKVIYQDKVVYINPNKIFVPLK